MGQDVGQRGRRGAGLWSRLGWSYGAGCGAEKEMGGRCGAEGGICGSDVGQDVGHAMGHAMGQVWGALTGMGRGAEHVPIAVVGPGVRNPQESVGQRSGSDP